MLASQGNVSQITAERRKKAPASQLDATLEAIGKVHKTVEERMTKGEKRVAQMPNMVLEQVRSIVKEEVKTIVREEVKSVVREEVKSMI